MGPRTAIPRAVGLGLSGGMLLGALYLLVRAIILRSSECDGLVGEDCAFEQQLAVELSSQMGLGAMGLALTGLGLLLSLRSKKPGAE